MPVIRILPRTAYQSIFLPLDTYLPATVPEQEIKAALVTMQKRFRAGASALGSEGTDWEFPKHYQHVRVFYVYLCSEAMYCLELARLIETAMDGFEVSWVGEFECFPVPITGGWALLAYHKSEFIAQDYGEDKNADYFHLAQSLGLEVIKTPI